MKGTRTAVLSRQGAEPLFSIISALVLIPWTDAENKGREGRWEGADMHLRAYDALLTGSEIMCCH